MVCLAERRIGAARTTQGLRIMNTKQMLAGGLALLSMTELAQPASAAVKFAETNFLQHVIPPTGSPAIALTSLSFTPTVSGTAVFLARGYCNVTPDQGGQNQISIDLAPTIATAFGSSTW